MFGKDAGYVQLQDHYQQSKDTMKQEPAKAVLKNTVEVAMHTCHGEKAFKQQLIEQGINTVVRRNEEGRVYGITFVDHSSRTVWNGSQLDKNLSANHFNELWNNTAKSTTDTDESQQTSNTHAMPDKEPVDQLHQLFDFLQKTQEPVYNDENGLIDALGGLLPNAQGEDYEELAFANRMKKKRKKRSRNH